MEKSLKILFSEPWVRFRNNFTEIFLGRPFSETVGKNFDPRGGERFPNDFYRQLCSKLLGKTMTLSPKFEYFQNNCNGALKNSRGQSRATCYLYATLVQQNFTPFSSIRYSSYLVTQHCSTLSLH